MNTSSIPANALSRFARDIFRRAPRCIHNHHVLDEMGDAVADSADSAPAIRRAARFPPKRECMCSIGSVIITVSSTFFWTGFRPSHQFSCSVRANLRMLRRQVTHCGPARCFSLKILASAPKTALRQPRYCTDKAVTRSRTIGNFSSSGSSPFLE